MQKLRIILALITIGCILGPIGTVAIIYRSDLSQMVITPQLRELLHFDGNNNSNDNRNNNNTGGGVTATFLNGQISVSEKTITLTFSITNGLTQDSTINSMSGTVEITADQYTLGTVTLNNPVTIHSGQSVTVTATGTLTQNSLDYLNSNYSHTTQLGIMVINGEMTQDGVAHQGGQSQDLGSVPVSW